MTKIVVFTHFVLMLPHQVVNRLEYPIRINRFDFYHSVFVPSYSRAIVPTDFVNSQMSLSIETRHMDRIQGIDRYPAKGQAWFFGTQQTLAVSDNFTVSITISRVVLLKDLLLRAQTHDFALLYK